MGAPCSVAPSWPRMEQVWRGTLRSFSSSTGYGFVHNEELQRHYGRPSQLSEGACAMGSWSVCVYNVSTLENHADESEMCCSLMCDVVAGLTWQTKKTDSTAG